MENNVSSVKTWLNFGLITGLILIVLELVFYLIELPRESPIRWVSFLVYIGAIIWAAKSFRDLKSGGFISYGRSFSIGFMTGFVAAILVAVYIFIFFQYIDPAMVQQIIDQQEATLIKRYPDWSDVQIEQAMNMSSKFMTPPMIAIWGLVASLIGVLLISLVASIFIKREEKLF